MKAIDLFSGPGGLTIGMRSAGIDPILCVEKSKDAINTYAIHHGDCTHINDNIQKVDFTQYRGKVDIVYGGPPCQPFSLGGLRKCWEDKRDMVPEYIRAVKECNPDFILMENVLGLTQKRAKGYFNELLEELDSFGYKLNWKILNSSYYGVCQNRKRVILIGSKEKTLFFPEATHGEEEGKISPLQSQDILPLSDNEERPNSPVKFAQYPDLRPSPYAGHIYNGGGRPINPHGTCHTIYASAGGYKTHWIDTKGIAPEYHLHLKNGGEPWEGEVPGAMRLSIKESAAIQSFPKDMVFCGSKSSQYTQIGDAVPPLLGEALGEAILDQANGIVDECKLITDETILLQSFKQLELKAS